MRLLPIALATFGLFTSTGDSLNFDRDRPGRLPPGWSVVNARPSASSRWEIRVDSSAPSRPGILAQISGPSADAEPTLAIFDNASCLDGDLSIKFKILSAPPGSRTAGVVWRYQDPGNYYFLRFSVDENNIRLFRVINGQPQMIAAEPRPHDLRLNQWYVAKVVYRGDKIRVLFGNRLLFTAADGAILKPGRTGLRTRAATTVYFDDFRLDRKG